MKKSDKAAQLKKHPKCYVCEGLGLTRSTFAGYERYSEIQFDHWKPKGLVGGNQADLVSNQWPVHAHPDGSCYLDDDFETSARRNCHKGKGNWFASGQEWVEAVQIYRRARKIRYADELLPTRKKSDPDFRVSIDWDAADGQVEFEGDLFPMMTQRTVVGTEEYVWRSFSTVVPPTLLWTDHEVQSRAADVDRVFALAVHLRASPLLTPILCRYADNRLYVFDGNHRLTAFLLARPNQPVPVTIFQGPDPEQFLEVVEKAHDELTQQKYQYTAKALKFSALSDGEIQIAVEKFGDEASEQLAWEGITLGKAKLRVAGKLTRELEQSGGWHTRWLRSGLADKSWHDFLGFYASLTPEDAPFSSKEYYRDNELENLKTLCRLFDEELFERLSTEPSAAASLKTKWWLAAHSTFATRAAQLVGDALDLPDTPKKAAYVPKKWTTAIEKKLRMAVKRWAESPAWRAKTTANNHPEVVAHLRKHGFTERYLTSGK